MLSSCFRIGALFCNLAVVTSYALRRFGSIRINQNIIKSSKECKSNEPFLSRRRVSWFNSRSSIWIWIFLGGLQNPFGISDTLLFSERSLSNTTLQSTNCCDNPLRGLSSWPSQGNMKLVLTPSDASFNCQPKAIAVMVLTNKIADGKGTSGHCFDARHHVAVYHHPASGFAAFAVAVGLGPSTVRQCNSGFVM